MSLCFVSCCHISPFKATTDKWQFIKLQWCRRAPTDLQKNILYKRIWIRQGKIAGEGEFEHNSNTVDTENEDNDDNVNVE